MKSSAVYCSLLCALFFFAGPLSFCAAQSRPSVPVDENDGQKGASPTQPRKDEIAILKTDSEEVRLMKERYNTAIEDLALRTELYNGGKLDMSSLYVSMERVGKSKLALAVSPQEKLAAWQDLVVLYRSQEELADRKISGGFGSRTDVLATKYARLDAEISLLNAKKALKATPKVQLPSAHR